MTFYVNELIDKEDNFIIISKEPLNPGKIKSFSTASIKSSRKETLETFNIIPYEMFYVKDNEVGILVINEIFSLEDLEPKNIFKN